MPRRFGMHASLIQLVALLFTSGTLDGGTTLNACTLASVLFWTCSIALLLWHRGRVSRMDLLFFRWGLWAFALIGTPLFRAVIGGWEWLPVLLIPSMAVLVVGALMYVVTRAFGVRSP